MPDAPPGHSCCIRASRRLAADRSPGPSARRDEQPGMRGVPRLVGRHRRGSPRGDRRRRGPARWLDGCCRRIRTGGVRVGETPTEWAHSRREAGAGKRAHRRRRNLGTRAPESSRRHHRPPRSLGAHPPRRRHPPPRGAGPAAEVRRGPLRDLRPRPVPAEPVRRRDHPRRLRADPRALPGGARPQEVVPPGRPRPRRPPAGSTSTADTASARPTCSPPCGTPSTPPATARRSAPSSS